ncbi:Uma2 family endonuclease [Dictyobacter arantiisoli]|uniref:Putative restriction endonuclease domain-containing protein n=1 Tax=Dictyobacter arantiisoli TaxID=2014874 RepID=A0A5A5TE25_9CHLR|nr:Uma2 family endonuclease [Dictyobacter arantiisoli]GCF09323.1 hypothetical protein KDI_28870 [Dictyobacter arantiisoli]
MVLPEYPKMSVEDYLILDRNSHDARYEYFEGQLRMLAGGSTYHSAIIANLTILLGTSLRGGPCWIYNSDIRLQLAEDRYVHPDITVSCNPDDHELEDMLRYPCLVVEVLSPTTEGIDRGRKSIYYQECATIQEYVLVDSLSMRVEVYQREDTGWKLYTYGPESTVTLDGLDIQFAIEEIYRGMKLDGKRARRK